MTVNKLFAVYMGGRATGCSIELHDVVFIVSESIEKAHEKLAKKWFGYPNKCHIDTWMEMTHVDGYNVQLSNELTESNTLSIFFINFGGYKQGIFEELHQSAFYVAQNKQEAIQRARRELCPDMFQRHLDDSYDIQEILESDVDDVIEVKEVDGYYIKLIPCEMTTPLEVVVNYTKLPVSA